MKTSRISLRILDPIVDTNALQKVLEGAPRYAQNISGAPQPENAAESIFLALPEKFDKSKKFVYGIWLDSQLIGCIDVLREFPNQEIATVGLLLLSESHQGKGFGKSAYRTLEEILSTWPELKRIRLSVVSSNAEALGFWNKMGFKETGARKPYENGSVKSEAIILEKPIE